MFGLGGRLSDLKLRYSDMAEQCRDSAILSAIEQKKPDLAARFFVIFTICPPSGGASHYALVLLAAFLACFANGANASRIVSAYSSESSLNPLRLFSNADFK